MSAGLVSAARESATAPAAAGARYLESLRLRGASPQTVRSRRWALHVFFAHLAGRGVDDVRVVTAEHVTAYLLSLHQRSIWTRLTYLTAVRCFFAYLEKTDTVLMNPCRGLVLRRQDRLPRRVLSAQEAARIIGAVDVSMARGLRDRAMLEVVYSSGLRRTELARLCVFDLDLGQGYVRVRGGKGGKDRVVPLGEAACRAVRAYLARRAAWVQDHPQTALWLDVQRPHGALTAAFVGERVSDLARAAGIMASAHAWRHGCATELVRGGAALPFVQRLLGHASLETTQVYTRVVPADVQAMHRRCHPRSS